MEAIERTKTNNLSTRSNSMPLFEKLFVWSLITEPLLFFNLPFTLLSPFSKVFNLVFLLLYTFNILIRKRKIPIINVFKKYYVNFFIYTLLLFLTSLIALFFGNYHLINTKAELGVILRPITEFFIWLFYVAYFVFLPKHILRTDIQLNYLLKWIVRTFYFVLVVGLIDYIFLVFGDIDLISRHLFDREDIGVGYRFHSILGEPRDAVVYLLFGTSILFIISAIKNTKPPNILLLGIIFLCLASTKSFSGVIGILFGLLLMLFFLDLSLKRLFAFFCVITFLIISLYFSIEYIEHFGQYYNDLSILLTHHSWNNLTSMAEINEQMPALIWVQSPDIIPSIEFFYRLIEFDFFHLFFGSGIGSASYFLNNYFDFLMSEVNNPRAEFTRLIYETGLIGMLFYLLALFRPILLLRSSIEKIYMNQILIITCLFYGSVLGHRSHLGLIFAGIVITLLVNRNHNLKLH